MMPRHLHVTSYRLAFWHAPKRARHDEGDVLDCIFCQYSEGVARMRDVVGYLHRRGFSIVEFDDRSFTVVFDESPGRTEKALACNKSSLLRLISGQQSFSFHSSRFE